MRISNNGNNPLSNPAQDLRDLRSSETAKAYGADRTEGAKRATRTEASSTTDSAKPEISARAREFAHAKGVASKAPDVREEKIAELKRRIAEGKYSVDGEKIADRMVNDHMQMGIG
jgi:negative regulator of flagellin synthesis FlgM